MVDISNAVDDVSGELKDIVNACLDDDMTGTCDYILKHSGAEAYIAEQYEDENSQTLKVIRNRVKSLEQSLDAMQSVINLLLRGQERMIVKLDKLPNRGEI